MLPNQIIYLQGHIHRLNFRANLNLYAECMPLKGFPKTEEGIMARMQNRDIQLTGAFAPAIQQ